MADTAKWTKQRMFNREEGSRNAPKWPNEMMVKLFSSSAYTSLSKKLLSRSNAENSLLEIGCFAGNNLRFFSDRGFRLFGTEINPELLAEAKRSCKALSIEVDLRLGTNTDLPFLDSEIDVLVAINTLHYSSGLDLKSAVLEYSRVLRHGGLAYIETVGPKHFVCTSSKKVGQYRYVWKHEDFRLNEEFAFFESSFELKEFLNQFFRLVEVVERIETYNSNTLHFLIAICEK